MRAPPGSSALQWLRPKAVEMRVLGDAAIAHLRLPKWHLTIRNTCSTFARTLPNLFTLASRQPAAGFGLLLHRPEPLRDAPPPLRTLSSSVSCASSRCRKFQIVVSSGIGSRPSSRSQNARVARCRRVFPRRPDQTDCTTVAGSRCATSTSRRSEMQRLKILKLKMPATPDQQISLTDPDSRSMATSGRGSGAVGYRPGRRRHRTSSNCYA